MSDTYHGAVGVKPTESIYLTALAYFCFGLLVLIMGLFVTLSVKHVTVQMNDKTITGYTFSTTVGDVIREMGIKGQIGPSKDPDSLAEGEAISFLTVSENLASRLTDGMIIKVYQDKIKKSVTWESVRAPVRREWNIFLEPGQERVISQGRNGIAKDTHLISYRDGNIVSNRKIDSRLISAPSPTVVATGSYESVSRQGALRTGRSIKFLATAYTHTGYRTAIGAKTRRGIVAVDPRVIPFGTRLYIEGYGYAVAADTGGLIKGRRIDVFLDTYRECINWGKRPVNVFILGK